MFHDNMPTVPSLKEAGITLLRYMDPEDDWLSGRIKRAAKGCNLRLEVTESLMFLNRSREVDEYFTRRSRFRQTPFYIEQRKQRGYLLTESGGPVGDQWTYDSENRKKYPRGKDAPAYSYPEDTPLYREALREVL